MLLPSIRFNHDEQHFESTDEQSVETLVQSMNKPLSLTFQLTRNCNYRCVYCSEPPGIRTRSLNEMKSMIDKLQGMRRIIFSGGEPMLYEHFWEILEYARDKFELVVLSTNASRITRESAERLKGMIDYIDVTVDGPRKQHDLIRGHYDEVIRGLMHVALVDIPRSIICVYLPGNRDVMHYICQTGDMLGAHKVKILTPIPKGMSVGLFEDFITGDELTNLKAFLENEKQKNGWRIRITITDWMKVGQGHAILMEPDGRMIASPVWDESECLLPFGNLAEQDAEVLWNQNYPFKENHLKKYLEKTLILA
jgi:MoaA/NifB/PqqE/SkfB family radical SAM enzyme